MSRSFTLAAIAMTLGSTPLAAIAQSAPPQPVPIASAPASPDATAPHAHHTNRLARALQSLDLTPDQRAKVRAAMQAYRESRSTATPETRAHLRADLETILTPDQRVRFEATMRRPAPVPVASPA